MPCCVDKDNQCYMYIVGDVIFSLQLSDEGKKCGLAGFERGSMLQLPVWPKFGTTFCAPL